MTPPYPDTYTFPVKGLTWVVMLLLTSWTAWHEFKYVIFGVTCDAEVYRVKTDPDPHDPDITQWAHVHVRWFDEVDGERTDALRMWAKEAPSVGDSIAIDYLRGVKESRVAGDRNYIAITAFSLAAGCGVSWFVIMWRRGMRRRKSS